MFNTPFIITTVLTYFPRTLSVVTDLPQLYEAAVADGEHTTAAVLTGGHDLSVERHVFNNRINVWTHPGNVPAYRLL